MSLDNSIPSVVWALVFNIKLLSKASQIQFLSTKICLILIKYIVLNPNCYSHKKP